MDNPMKSIRVNFYYFALLGLALLLQGCIGTSKATRFYALDNGDTSTLQLPWH